MLALLSTPISLLTPTVAHIVNMPAAPAPRSAVLTTTVTESSIFPTTTVVSGGLLQEVMGGPDRDVYQGAAADLDLGELLDDVPADMDGDKGLQRDSAGVERIKERMAIVEEKAEQKAALLMELEATGKPVNGFWLLGQ
eukprot:3902563-Prymnesium_polylepis.1